MINTHEEKAKAASVEVIIKPVCLRFSLFEGDVYYHFVASADAQLDRMERLMGVVPEQCASFTDANLGFLPVASAVLIRGDKTVLVDPGSPHLGFYGLLGKALQDHNRGFTDIDTIVVTHWHHDHCGNIGMFPGAELVVGDQELDFGRDLYGAGAVRAGTENLAKVIEVADREQICPGVTALRTPGHTPGSLSIIVDHDQGERTIITGDTIITREQFETGNFSHWYSDEEKRILHRSMEKIKSCQPTRIIPGHDQPFRVSL